MSITWREYQEKAAAFFRSLGLDASTDIKIKGVRTRHDVDVLVKSQHIGFEIVWVVECKYWKTPVSKLHVLGLRQIVSDVGADRGILLSESGFQSGAIEAANLTNVQVTSLEELNSTASKEIYSMRLRELYDKTEACNDRYWAIPKKQRIEHGLRPHVFEFSYSGVQIIDLCRDLLSRALRDLYPFRSESFVAAVMPGLPEYFKTPKEVISVVESKILELERKLSAYEGIKNDT
jgi:restriction system protein